jgi:uncharacterized delta-60 repeat protein
MLHTTRIIVTASAICVCISLSNAQVLQEWSERYDGPAHGVDIPNDFTTDRRGNIYITGRSSGVGTGQDFATVKYSNTGEQLLVLRYNSPANSWDEANSIAVDDSGYIYVTGSSFYTSSNRNLVTIKYSADGEVRWAAPYTPQNSAQAKEIVVDDSGNVYVVGKTWDLSGPPDLTTIKYSASGDQMWVCQFHRDTSRNTEPTGCVVDSSGNVYVVGASSSYDCPEGICTYDFTILKYDTRGGRKWVRYYSRSNASDDRPRAVALDHSGDIVVAGFTESVLGSDFVTVKYSPEGDERWVQVYDGPSGSFDQPTGLTIDSVDNVIVCGTSWNNTQAFNFAVVRYNTQGVRQWFAEYDGPNNTRDFCSGVACDREGNIYVTGGSSIDFTYFYDCTSVKFSNNGNQLWSAVHFRTDSASEQGSAIAVDTSGNVYVGGTSAGQTNGLNYLTIKYRQLPNEVADTEQSTSSFILAQNYPNPFNPSTRISYQLTSVSFVSLNVYDVLGREVATLVNEQNQPGAYTTLWGGRNKTGMRVGSGIYFYRLEVKPVAGTTSSRTERSFIATRKLILLN